MPAIECGFRDEQYGRKLLVVHGARIGVNIGLDPSWTPAERRRPPHPDTTGISALIDTGSIDCCIDSELAMRLGLPIHDKRIVHGATSSELVSVCLAQVHIPRLRYTIYGSFSMVPLRKHKHEQDVLIGRTLLRDFILVYDGSTANVTLEYSRP